MGCKSRPYLATKMRKYLSCQNLTSKITTWPTPKNYVRFQKEVTQTILNYLNQPILGDPCCFKKWTCCFIIALRVWAKALSVIPLLPQIAGHLALPHPKGKKNLLEVTRGHRGLLQVKEKGQALQNFKLQIYLLFLYHLHSS